METVGPPSLVLLGHHDGDEHCEQEQQQSKAPVCFRAFIFFDFGAVGHVTWNESKLSKKKEKVTNMV